MTAGVYLLHFDRPYKHARHYVGYSDNIEERVAAHIKGQGSRLCEVAVKAGVKLLWARTWVGANRHFERKLHQRGKSIYCPICNRRRWHKRMPQPLPPAIDDNDVKF